MNLYEEKIIKLKLLYLKNCCCKNFHKRKDWNWNIISVSRWCHRVAKISRKERIETLYYHSIHKCLFSLQKFPKKERIWALEPFLFKKESVHGKKTITKYIGSFWDEALFELFRKASGKSPWRKSPRERTSLGMKHLLYKAYRLAFLI